MDLRKLIESSESSLDIVTGIDLVTNVTSVTPKFDMNLIVQFIKTVYINFIESVRFNENTSYITFTTRNGDIGQETSFILEINPSGMLKTYEISENDMRQLGTIWTTHQQLINFITESIKYFGLC
jgi:hypothetical protein